MPSFQTVIAQICGEGDEAWEAIANLDEDLVGILGELQQPVVQRSSPKPGNLKILLNASAG